MMLAAVRTKYGPPEKLSVLEIAKPVPADNQILVKVFATTVNRTDCAVLTGSPFIMRFFTGLFKPKSIVPGTDFAGVIEEIGKNVKNFKVGDKVFGFNDIGLPSQAQYLAVSENEAIATLPQKFSFDQAVASLEAAHYAFNFMNKVNLKPGQKVLVNGATGAVGSAIIQFLKYKGLQVTAVCHKKHFDQVKALGPDKLIDYSAEDFTQLNEKFDFVFDAVGKSTFFKCKRLLTEKGIYISSELGPYSQNIFLALAAPLMKKQKVVFPVPTNIKRSIQFIKELIEKEKFKPLIDRRYPLTQIAEAYQYVASGQKIGNVIINP